MPAVSALKPRTIAAVHRLGDELRLLIAKSGDAGGPVSLTTIKSMRASETAAAEAILDEAEVDTTLWLVPGSEVVSRVTAIPETGSDAAASPEALADALVLIAESDLPSGLTPYRRAAGVVRPGRSGSAASTVLLTGWRPAESRSTSTALPQCGTVVAVAETSAMAILAQAVGGIDFALSADPGEGSLSILAAGPERTCVRSARIPAESAGAFAAAAGAALLESAAAAGVTTEVSPQSLKTPAFIMWPVPSPTRLLGAERDSRWIAQFGLAAGALLAATSSEPAVRSLASLHLVAPKTRPPVLRRITGWLGTPGRAAAAIALSIAVLVLTPMAVAYARVKSMERLVTDEASLMQRNADAERELAFYHLLGEKRWPMTKLASDVASSAPVGITLDLLEIGQGEGVTIRGVAESSELVTMFRENLGKTRVFTQVTTPSITPSGNGVQFQLSAKIAPGGATFAAKPIDDFGAKTLAERMYGEGARASRHTATRTERGAGRDRRAAAGNSTPSRGNSGSAAAPSASGDRSTRSTAGDSGRAAPVVPPPLSDAQIAAMDTTAAMMEFGRRKSAAAQPGLDEPTRRRLTEEFEKARQRMIDARGQGAAGGNAK